MPAEVVDTLVIGAGQAGIAMSEHLSAAGVGHVVLERSRIAENWRTARWDALVANGPAWHDRFPNMEFQGIDPDAFPGKEAVADYFVEYARMIGAPVRCGVNVTRVARRADGPGFAVETSAGEVHARNLVVATGAFQKPVLPDLVPASACATQIHSHAYRNPGQLPAGAVLVVGSGSSGVQIAEELMSAGRRVFLSVGPHGRPPRRYRGRDFVWWLGALGKWDAETPAPGTEHVTIAVSGANGGHTIDFRKLAGRGMVLLGRAESFRDGRLHVAPDLEANIARGDADYLALLDEADAYAAARGLDLPPDPAARLIGPDPDCVTRPLRALDLAAEGVTAIVWATGYTSDFGWIDLDAFDDKGRPVHRKGVSSVNGLYFLGLPWLSRRGSSFIWGVWQDAGYIAGVIASDSARRTDAAPAP
ncbi:MAG: hypothetical protein RLZZ528_2252 [Pseudomonadota bacterium]